MGSRNHTEICAGRRTGRLVVAMRRPNADIAVFRSGNGLRVFSGETAEIVLPDQSGEGASDAETKKPASRPAFTEGVAAAYLR